MQFLYNSPAEVSNGFPPVSVVTEELLGANSIYNETVELFERLKHSNLCCACEKRRPLKIAAVVFLDEHFACSFPLALCDQCSRLWPIVATRTDRPIYFLTAGSLLAALAALAYSLQAPLPVVWFLLALLVGVWFLQRHLRSKPQDSKVREELTRHLVSKSPFFSKFLKAYPNGRLFWHNSLQLEPWSTDAEKKLFQSSLIAFDRGYVLSDMHGLNEEDGSLAICHAVFQYIDSAFHQELRQIEDSPIACQALVQFFPGRKRIIQTQVLPLGQSDSKPSGRELLLPQANRALDKALQSMPDFPVRGPIIVMYRSCNLEGTGQFRELTLPDAHPDYQRYVRAMHQTQEPKKEKEQDNPQEDSKDPDPSIGDLHFATEMMALPENRIRVEDLEYWQKAVQENRRLDVGIPDLLAASGEYDQAQGRWENLLEKSPQDRELLFGYARFLQRNGMLEKAASVCQSLIKLPDAGTDWYGFLAHLQHSMGFPLEAKKTLEQAPQGPKSEEFHFVAASVAQDVDDTAGALRELNAALAVNPLHGNSLLLRAKLLMIQGNNQDALMDVNAFVENEGPNLRAIQLKAYIIHRLEGIDKSIDYLSSCIEQLGQHPILNGLRADAYKESGKLTLALEDIDWVIENQPDLAVARQQRIEIRIENADADGAIADSQFLLDQGVENTALLSDYGYAKFLNEDYEEALELLLRAVELDSNNLSARYRLSQTYSKLGRIDDAVAELSAILESDSEHAIPFVVRGYHYMMLGQYARAGDDFDEALKIEPKEIQAMRGSALVCEMLGDRKRALKILDQVLELDPTNEECLLDRSRMSMSSYDLKGAEKDLNLVIQSSPDLLPALFSRAQLSIQLGKMDQALSDLDAILKEDPDFAPALIGRSAIYQQQGDDEKSQEDLDAAVLLRPESAEETEFTRAIMSAHIAFVQNRFEESIRASTQAIELDATNDTGYLRRAAAYWYSDQFAEAWEDFNHVIRKLEKESSTALNGRGGCAAELGDYEPAIVDLEKAIAMARDKEPDHLAYYLNNYARALISAGRFEEAQTALSESEELQPLNAWLFYYRALLHIARQEEQLACEDFQKAIESDQPPIPPRKKAKAESYIKKFGKKQNSSDD
ncbi:MAG: tetratricopeptide repeat protein [Planctomycetota bacterium]|nr:tetratricopeptide repeat protein [Planctomycetota bacterium]